MSLRGQGVWKATLLGLKMAKLLIDSLHHYFTLETKLFYQNSANPFLMLEPV